MKKIATKLTALAAILLLAFTAPTAQAATADLTDANTFPDAAFRTALQQALGATSVEATSVTSLDLTGKGITSIVGIDKFTELETLILDDNQIPFMNLKSNGKLKVLSLRNNKATTGPSSNNATNTTKHINFANNTPLEELYMSGCTAVTNFSAIANTYNITTLRVLDLKDCPSLGWSPGIAKQPGLVYLDLTNNGLSSSIGTTYKGVGINAADALPALKNLETLILANNGSVACVNVSGMTNLKYLDLSGTDFYFKNRQNAYGYFSQANKNNIEYLNLTNAKMSQNGTDVVDGFVNLKSLLMGGNNTFTSVSMNNCPAIENINVAGAANITTVTVTNSNLTSVPTINGDNCALLKTLVLDGNQFTDVPEVSGPFTCLSLQSNNFPAEYSLNGNTLEGLDLGSNGFTSLTVENSAMSALALGGNANLTEVHLHGNANLTKTASATGVSAAQGLYIKGLSALKVLDIENSNFSQLGQENSTDGCTGIEVLKAANNKFTTFSNAYTTFGSSGDNGYRPATPTRSSLERLTGLKYLDLSNNLLQDSLHLHKNTQLETLIVRNNRTITEYSDNSVVNKQFHTPGDPGEFNDTVGLRMLNLIYNKELKYIDISYTGIHHFARDGRLDKYKEDYYMANFAKRGNETAKNREPHYLLISNCNKLEEFYADYNGMKSAGFLKNFEGQGFDYLKRISMIETRGQDSYTMQGSWNPNGKDGCPNVEYINVANSDLDSVGVTKLPHLKYLNVSGNWTKNNWSHWSSTGVGHTLNLKANGELVECVADDCPHLVIAQANDKTNLTSLSLNNNPELKQVYVPNTGLARIDAEPYGHPDPNPDTRTQQPVGGLGLAGLNTATNLELLYCEDNSNLASLDVTANSNLKYLHAYNNAYGADGLNLSQNNNIVTAWVSNSGLTSLQLNGATALDSLKCYDNAALAALDVRASTAMRYLDLARCHVADLDVSSNNALVHFDCSNNVKCDDEQGNWLSDLNFASTALQTVVTNNNNLYNITLPTSLAALTRMEFAHNHINGIDLSGATSLAPEAIVDVDNGRTITAECAAFTKDNKPVKLYYFQLDENAGENGGFFLDTKTSQDELKGEPRPSLAQDNFSASSVNSWGDGVQGTVTGSRKAAAIGDIDSEKLYGTVAVLTPSSENSTSANGRAEYTYNNGRSTSTFYLDWSANANIVTEVEDVDAEVEVVSTAYYNLAGQRIEEMQEGVNIVVKTLKDGSTVTSKVMK